MKKPYCKPSIEVVRDQRISMHARALYAVLCSYVNAQGVCWPGVARLAQDLNCSKRTTHRLLTELIDHGVIHRYWDSEHLGSMSTRLLR